jgi:hypothetical protein
VQFLWHDTIDMQGGRILGEGVDGCIFEGPMWPCAQGSQEAPDPTNTRYVSKLVSVKDEESRFLKMAERLLGPELSQKYLARLQTECKPATDRNPSNPKNAQSLSAGEKNLKAWPKKGEACGELKKKLESGENISNGSKLMIIAKYPMTVSGWAEKLHIRPIPYTTVLTNIERAIPKFIFILQKLYQNPNEQLIHTDLHTGNIFIRFNPFEFGLADFGRCVFRRANEDPSQSFFGEFLITYVSRIPFFCRYSQVPLEARLLSFCYMKKLDVVNVTPATLVKAWENDNEVRETSSGSTDVIIFHRSKLLSQLLQRILFIAMVETIQSISRKLRGNLDAATLYTSFTSTEKKVIEFILTRYGILSPINTINEEIMNVYAQVPFGQGSHLSKFILKGIMAPYLQDGSSLDAALSSVQQTDLGILWADVVAGRSA